MKTSSKTKLKVERIIKKNSGKGLFESNNLFAKTFLSSLLKEQDEPPQNPENFTPEKNKEDFDNSLQPETSEKEFDVDGVSIEVHIENIKKIKQFSDKLNDFAAYLNDPHSTESLHKILSDNDKPGSLLRGITRKTSDGITRVAGEIEKLKEVLNSFIILAPKKLRDQEPVTSGG
jgi:patatin-like phospholipase/acyl hydrolase